MELEIQYFPQTDTLYIGSAETADDGYDIAENLIAHARDNGEVIGITLEHAAEILAPYLGDQVAVNTTDAPSPSILRDEGEQI